MILVLAAALALADDAAIRNLIATFAGSVSFYAKNLDTGAACGVREDEPVRTASTIKLPVMAAVFAAVDAGKAKWSEELTLRDAGKVSGSGVLSEFSDGTRLTLRDLVHLMIVVSDNTATNLIIDRFGTDYLNSQFGLKQTRLLRKVFGKEDAVPPELRKYGLGVSTPREMVLLLERIERGEAVSLEASRGMIAILKRQQYKDGVGRRAAFPVASKSGALDHLRSDVGILYTDRGRIAIAVTVDGLKTVDYSPDNAGNLFIWELSQAVMNFLHTPQR